MAINPEIEVLRRCKLKGLVVYLPPKQLPRELYLKVKRILEGIGGKWTRKAQGFVFRYNPQKLIQKIIRHEIVINLQKEYQIFETPPVVAREMVKEAGLTRNDLIMEPSAGRGQLLDELPKGLKIDAYEVFHDNRMILKAKGYRVVGTDFMKAPEIPLYSKIIANPPFSGGQDIDHIMKMYKVLKVGGRIVSLASTSWSFNSRKKAQDFREFLNAVHAKVKYIPENTFKESGTSIPMTMIVIDKKAGYPAALKRDLTEYIRDQRVKYNPPPKEEKIDVVATWREIERLEQEHKKQREKMRKIMYGMYPKLRPKR